MPWVDGPAIPATPRAEPHDILLHVALQDHTNLLQQQALGILGVYLVHAAFFEAQSLVTLLAGLRSALSLERVEIDVLELRGHAFSGIDGPEIGARLVLGGLARAVLFEANGTQVQPLEHLRKRPLVMERSIFVDDEPPHRRMLEIASARLGEELGTAHEPVLLPELTVAPIAGRDAPGETETRRRLARLLELGGSVLLTGFPEVYCLTSYLRRHTRERLRFVLGSAHVLQVLHEAHYRNLMGGLLEALGRLFAVDVKIYVYPMKTDAFRPRTRWRRHSARHNTRARRGVGYSPRDTTGAAACVPLRVFARRGLDRRATTPGVGVIRAARSRSSATIATQAYSVTATYRLKRTPNA